MIRPGYTLIEVLAVVALLGLVAVLVAPSLTRAVMTDPVARGARLARDADRAARQHAVGQGAVLSLRDGRLVTTVAKEPIASTPMPDGTTVRWRAVDDTPLEAVAFDRGGRSVDLLVEISSPTQQRRYRILGLTGAWEALASEPAP